MPAFIADQILQFWPPYRHETELSNGRPEASEGGERDTGDNARR